MEILLMIKENMFYYIIVLVQMKENGKIINMNLRLRSPYSRMGHHGIINGQMAKCCVD